MRTRRLIGTLSIGLLIACSPSMVSAQTTGTSGSSSSSGSSLAGGSGLSNSSGGGGSSSSSTNLTGGSGLVTSASTISATSGTASTTSVPSSANILASSYVNPYTLGLPANYQGKFGAQNITPNITGTFGKYIYVATPSTTSATSATAATQGVGFSTFGQPRAPVYSTSFAETFPIIRPSIAQVQADARDAIARSSMLKNKDNIKVGVNGTVVTLSGTVNSETERSVAEGMVRMTPGVGDVLNNLVVDAKK